MKVLRLLAVMAAALTAFALGAATYRVDDIPNVHRADSTRFVSNPDGILSRQAEADINAMLQRLQQQTSAEVVCIAVDDIDGDIDDFATELMRKWGVGKKDTNNGVMLLIVKDQRQVVIRTGVGVEGLLPDGLCGSIIRKNITPRFREGDYDGGTSGAIADIAGILSSPEARDEIMSKYANNATGDDFDLFRFYLTLCAYAAAICLILVIGTAIKSRNKTRYQKYLAANGLYSPLLFASFLGLGLPLVAFVPLALWRHNLRRGKHLCPDCGTPMQLIDEEHDNDFLTRAQDIEEKIGAVDYDVWRCPADGETEVIPYVSRSSAYTPCPVCHARTMRVISDRTTVQPTTTRPGLRVITRQCVNCGYSDDENHTLPRVAPVVIVGGGSGIGGGGGGIGGGSFGGGFTAGGGARGGW